MRNTTVALLLTASMIAAGCAASNKSAKDNKNAPKKQNLSEFDTSQVEILNVSPPYAACLNWQPSIELT